MMMQRAHMEDTSCGMLVEAQMAAEDDAEGLDWQVDTGNVDCANFLNRGRTC
jgi:hypothetical protein